MGLEVVSLAATAVSAIVGGIGQMNSANAAAQAASYNAEINRQNAKIAIEQGNSQAQAQYRAGALKLGAVRAAMAASGIDPNSGSALSTQSDIGTATGENVANTRYNAQLRAYGFNAQAQLQDFQASQSRAAGTIGMVSSLLGGASQFAGKWTQFSNAGWDPFGSGGGGGGGDWASPPASSYGYF